MIRELEIPKSLDAVGDQLVSRKNVLKFLDVANPRTLNALVLKGEFPGPATRVGKEHRWLASDLRAWLISLKDKQIGQTKPTKGVAILRPTNNRAQTMGRP